MTENQTIPGQKARTNEHVPYLDGVRGLAILLVAAGHIFYEYYIFKIGWIGLNLFFILSGYLITQRLFHYKVQSIQNYFRNFYVRRILRIFPLYYGVLIFFLIVLPGLAYKYQLHYSELNQIQSCYWLYTSNWHIISNGLPGQPLFFHFWSLAVEEQFYLIWPILFLVFHRTRSRYFLIAILMVVSIVTRISTAHPLYAYLNTLTAAEPLLLGSLLSIMQKEGILIKMNKWLKVGAILSSLFLVFTFIQNSDLHITNGLLMKYGYSAIDIIMGFFVCSLLVGHFWGLRLRYFFSLTWIKWLGKYSYAIYVFHWIILQTVILKLDSVLKSVDLNQSVAYLMARITGIVLILLLSYCSYHFYEKYFIGLKKYFSEDKDWNWALFRIPLFQKNKGKLAGN